MRSLVEKGLIGGLSAVAMTLLTATQAESASFTVEGNRLRIELPETVSVQPASQFGVEIAVSDRIKIIVETLADETSIPEYKKETLANTGIFQRFVVDSATVLLHEDTILGKPAFRVFTYVDTGKVKLTCRDNRVIDLTEAEARKVIQICQSIRS
ncbi:MAG: hypothetical protein NW224_27570 [Leptolyngbyaceae cyanobacterium bins.302]|nr:hypothetical protein [Leptolyngbyaceae cyanobacterium bins.302]